MSLNIIITSDMEKKIRWGSHIPVNNSVISALPITGVMELGAGFNSTPIFFKSLENVVSIEADAKWIATLQSEAGLVNTDTQLLIHHDVPTSIKRGTLRSNIPKSIRKEAIKFYSYHIKPELNYLFVDQYAGFRVDSLIYLHDKFDVIAYHDAQPADDPFYDYTAFKPSNDYLWFRYETFPGYTGVIVSKKFHTYIDDFINTLKLESELYASKHGIDYSFTFNTM